MIVFLLTPAAAHAGKFDAQVDAVQNAYRSVGDLSADFTQTTFVKMLDKTIVKRGTFYYKKGGKFRINYRGSGEKNYVSDGATLWVFVPNDKASMTTFDVDGESVPKEALTFLSGFNNLKRDFRIKKSKAFSDLAPDEVALHLKPKKKSTHFKELDAKFNAQNLLVELKVHNLSGNVSDYFFTNIQTSTGLANNLFTP